MNGRPLRVLLTMPAYWPAQSFGGPVTAARELVRRIVERGIEIEIVTTTLEDVGRTPARRTRIDTVDGARVTYLATPLRYRWMGITPTLPLHLRRLVRPDLVHVSGFRDPVSTVVAAWARRRRIPYVFEPLGMAKPRLRKVRLKHAFDATVARGVIEGAELVLVVSEREADDIVSIGIDRDRIVVRGLGFPDPAGMPQPTGALRAAIGVGPETPVALSVGRIASGKGIEHLVEAARRVPELHVALVGPDDRHAAMAWLGAAAAEQALRGRIHLLGPTAGPPLDLYGDADVFVLASGGDSFGLVAAEAAAAGTPVVVTSTSGIAATFESGEALVVAPSAEDVVGAIERVVREPSLRERLADGGRAAARRHTWDAAAEIQVAIYRRAAARTASTNASTLGS